MATRDTEKKRNILRAAAHTFLMNGFEATSMNVVAERANVTKPGLYYHFRSKHELLFAAMSYALDIVERETRRTTVQAESSEEQLHEILLQTAQLIMREREGAFTLLVIDETKSLLPDDQRTINRRKRAHFDMLRALLIQLEKEGKLREGIDPTVASFSLLGMLAFIPKWYRKNGTLPSGDVARQVTELAIGSVLNDDRREMALSTAAQANG